MPEKRAILVIEDDHAISNFICRALTANDYKAIPAASGKEGLSLFFSHSPDLVLLDLGLPDMDGLEVLEQFSDLPQEVPTIIISARDRESEKVKALDMGADASMVAVMQFVRMVFGMACLPSIIVLADRRIEGDQMVPEEGQGTHFLERKKAHVSLRKFLPTFAVALAAGILGKLSGVPAGTLSASLIAVIVLKFAGSAPPMPMWVRRLAQVVSGCCIGAGITRDQIFQLRQLILPALVLIAGYILVCVGMGRAISRAFRMDLKESMLSLSPAGATEMALIAADLGVHSTNLVVLQICRLLGVTVIFPQIFALLSNLIG